MLSCQGSGAQSSPHPIIDLAGYTVSNQQKAQKPPRVPVERKLPGIFWGCPLQQKRARGKAPLSSRETNCLEPPPPSGQEKVPSSPAPLMPALSTPHARALHYLHPPDWWELLSCWHPTQVQDCRPKAEVEKLRCSNKQAGSPETGRSTFRNLQSPCLPN